MANDQSSDVRGTGVFNEKLCDEKMAHLRSEFEALAKVNTVKAELNAKIVETAIARIDKAYDAQKDATELLKDKIPSNCIERIAGLEGWRKYIVGSYGSVAVFMYLLWKYIEHSLAEHADIILEAKEIVEKIQAP